MKNNRHRILLLTVVVFIVLSITTVVYANDVRIDENNLNVRSGPGLDNEVIGQAHKDETYPIIEEEGNWVKIQMNNATGWVTKDYITITSSTDSDEDSVEVEEIETDSITVKYGLTNIRSGPSVDFKIVDTVQKGEILQTTGLVDGWYEIELEENKGYIPQWLVESGRYQINHNESSNLTNKTIVIDAGHGGIDAGAIGASGNYEKEYTMMTAQKLKSQLELLGANVILTRKTDHYLTLSGRAAVSNNEFADAFISIHYNSTPEFPSASGLNTYSYSEKDSRLAEEIKEELVKTTEMRDRGTREESYQVLRENHRTAVLLELGFLSNVEEESNIQSGVFQQKLSKGIINGLNRYFMDE